MFSAGLPGYSASMTSARTSPQHAKGPPNGLPTTERGSVLRITRSDDPILKPSTLAAVYGFVIECYAKKTRPNTSTAREDGSARRRAKR